MGNALGDRLYLAVVAYFNAQHRGGEESQVETDKKLREVVNEYERDYLSRNKL
jgi:uncharacterized membrane protein